MNKFKVVLIKCYNYPQMLGAIGEIVGEYTDDEATFTLVDFPEHSLKGSTVWYCFENQIRNIDDGNDIIEWEECLWQPDKVKECESITSIKTAFSFL